MAEDSLGQRKEFKAPWTKLFTAFKVALDIKKLLLAAAGIVAMSFGWWVLASMFYSMRSEEPRPEKYLADAKEKKDKDDAWRSFKISRERWNLLYEMAGPGPNTAAEAKKFDAADIASSWEQYEEIKALEAAHVPAGDKSKAKSLEELRQEVAAREGDRKASGLVALARFEELLKLGRTKPFGRLRTLPWFEDRGPNPYLAVTEKIKQGSELRSAPGQLVRWIGSQVPVLMEPLVKMLAPIVYFFDARAGGWNRIYLIMVILWTLAVWGFFGGAISRMAAVQVARNDKVGLRETIRFVRERFQSYFSAPVFPLIFLGILTFFLILFGFFAGLIPIIGDVVLSGLLWPIVIVLGLVMAVVLVGLVGWPLMNPTISAEGSDSFDALSRSYSYVYQAPWHYLWYSTVALVYGGIVVFFVGLMGSLMVFLGEWGVSQAPFLSSSEPANDREPHYLFVYAPTSFGWRDLLLHSSPYAKPNEDVTPRGRHVDSFVLSKDYMDTMKPWNYIGAFLVAAWLYVLFLLIVGFGYSYFWTAATIIYLLMRQKVDDTDMDEIHLEEEESDGTFAKDMTAPAPSGPPTGTPGAAPSTGNVTMVEAPTLRPAARAAPTPVGAGTSPAASVPATSVPVSSMPAATPEPKPAGDNSPPPPTNL